MIVNPELKYTRSHEWVRFEENTAYIGITDYAQSKLGSLVFLELPEADDDFEKGDPFIVAESVKAVADVYTPLSGTVIKVNEELADHPGQVNKKPYESWFVALEMNNPSELDELMDSEAYEAFCQQEE